MNASNHLTITICGDGGTGKSCLALRFVRSHWTNIYDPTIEDCYSITRKIDGQIYHISITDTAGQMEYRSLWAESNSHSDAFLFVYDITNQESLNALKEFNALVDRKIDAKLKYFKRKNQMLTGDANFQSQASSMEERNTPDRSVKVVVGNMCDLPHNRQVLAQTGENWARKNGCSFMEISAKENLNVEEVLELTVKKVVQARKRAASTREPEIENRKLNSNGKLTRFRSIERINSASSTISLEKPLQQYKRESIIEKGIQKMARWISWNIKNHQITDRNWRGCFQVH